MVQGEKAGVTIPAIPMTWAVTVTSATTTPSRGARGSRAEGQGYGLVLFAAILLAVIGCFNLIYGIAAIANSHVFVANAHYVFANLRTWGWITLILAVLQLLSAAGVMAGNQVARWFAVAVLGLNAIDQMFFSPAYPFWSLTIIAMDVVALWACAPTVAARTWPPSTPCAVRVRRHHQLGPKAAVGDGPDRWSPPRRILGILQRRRSHRGPGMSSQVEHAETIRRVLTVVERR